MTTDITVVIPTHPARRRNGMLNRAVASVLAQTVQPDDIIIVNDLGRVGAAETRNRGLNLVRTAWVAFLDSDDEFMSNHLETLCNHLDGDADVLYTGCRVVDPNGNEVPLQEDWGRFGRAFDGELLRQRSYIPVTSMVWTDLAQNASFGAPTDSIYDDWGFYLRLLDAGSNFLHIPEVTWIWHHHGANTSGQTTRGDAA